MALLGMASDMPLEVRGTSVVPREFTLALLRRGHLLGVPAGVVVNDWECLDIEVKGTAQGRPVVRHAVAWFPPRPEWHLSADGVRRRGRGGHRGGAHRVGSRSGARE